MCVTEKISEVEWKVVKWFRHVERLSEEMITESVYNESVKGRRDRG